ncbi:putative membrane protein [Escherichia coli 88.1467]|nr:putative membrane protein [Escherichia coli]EHV60221.1 putative membrane protein [Escherichia coli DEC6C]EIN41584.1 putative membrane protein [Escherichia coli FRIK1990]EIN59476.1 putative membrane protein [Escherichia coli PA9]EIN76016.1 putative membrane protein [Escherichia coli PA14]EIP55573.1 putative membrane protein [Escherichia coli EC4448]EIQ43098.1 putative membrane protein [Shigella sonnei 3233-85]EKI38188.1 putative membrane protein [Escherichia coli 3006]EKV78717.1 putative 
MSPALLPAFKTAVLFEHFHAWLLVVLFAISSSYRLFNVL